MNDPKFQLYLDTSSEFRHRLKSANGKIILHASEGYSSKQACKNGITSIQANAPFDSRYKRKVATNDQHYFVLVAGNGEPLGMSETYTTKYAMENGITAVKRDAPGAPTEDLTVNQSN